MSEKHSEKQVDDEQTSQRQSELRERVYFTIASKNYLAYAATLMQSLELTDPAARRFVILVDEPGSLPEVKISANVVFARELGIPTYQDMTLRYSIMELNTAVKPYAFLWLLEKFQESICFYIDPDIRVFRRLSAVESKLQSEFELALTPHITAPLQDGKNPDDLTIMKSGVWNLGFAAIRKSTETLRLLHWWADRCSVDCRSAVAENIFTDQRWMDLAPCFVSATAIVRDPSYNVAYWNLAHRSVLKRKEQLLVDGTPVSFIHFSGVVPNNGDVFSKHQDRLQPQDLGDLRPYFDEYRATLLANGWETSRHSPYSYGKTKSGRNILDIGRAYYSKENPQPLTNSSIEASGWSDRIVDDLDQLEPSLESLGPPYLTRLVYHCWQNRDDLKANFAVRTPEGRRGLLGWFASSAKREHNVDEISLHAAAQVAVFGKTSDLKRILRWPPVSAEFHPLPSRQFSSALSELISFTLDCGREVKLPRAFALIWEQRQDLRHAFPLSDVDSWRGFVRWCYETGPREGAIDVNTLAKSKSFFLQHLLDEPPRPPLLGPRSEQVFYGYDGSFGRLLPEESEDERGRQVALTAYYVFRLAKASLWPDEFCSREVNWLNSRQPGLGADQPISSLLFRIYKSRPDLTSTFDLTRPSGTMGLLGWFLTFGFDEYGLDARCISDELRRYFLKANDTGLTRAEACLWATAFPNDAVTEENSPNFSTIVQQWIRSEGAKGYLASRGMQALLGAPAKNRAQPKLVDIGLSGYWTAMSGRGEDVRMTKRALDAAGIHSEVYDRALFQGDFVKEGPLRPHSLRLCISHYNAESAYLDQVWHSKHRIHSDYQIGYWAWELSEFPLEWMNAFQFYDEIWASTEFARASFASKSPRPVHLMPMVVEAPEVDVNLGRMHFNLPQDAFLFFFHFDFRSFIARKNPEAAIEAFLKAFGSTDHSVGLVIKTINREHDLSSWLRIERMAKSDPRIVLMDCELTRLEVTSLIHACDCYLSLHRSEGFGRGIAEAMLLKKPVICTAYSGNMDFCNPRTALLVNYSLVPVRKHEYVGTEGQVWADVDVEHAAHLMKEVFQDSDLRNAIAGNASEFIRSQYSAERVGKLYRDRLLSIFASAARSSSKRHPPLSSSNKSDGALSKVRNLLSRAKPTIFRP